MNLPPWTVTFLQDDENCPHKAWRKYVAKDLPRTDPSPEMLWGRQVHTGFEARLSAAKVELPPGMKNYEPFALAIDTSPGTKLVEYKMGITASLAECGFFDTGVWGRGILDVAVVNGERAVFFDWKTGNSKYENPFELECHALLLKVRMPGLVHVTGRYVWLKEMRVGKPYDLSNFARTHNDVRTRVKDMEARPIDKPWPKKPNVLCGFCEVKDCEFNRSKDNGKA